jgi:hypothetical protein
MATDRKIEITIADKSIRLQNFSANSYILYVEDPFTSTKGYRNASFKPNTWCQTNIFIWEPSIKSGMADIVLEDPNNSRRIRYRVHMDSREIEDITGSEDSSITKRVSIIIPAYKAHQFLSDCLEPLIHESVGNPHLDMEILVGIDNCLETAKEMSKNVYPKVVKTYFFDENVGPYVIRNTLAAKASGDYLVFFDADDIPFSRMVSTIIEEMGTSSMVNWKFKWFNDGEPIVDTSILENGFLTHGVFAIRKEKFLSMNGFFPWRTSADSEFQQRSNSLKIGPDPINRYLFFRRRSQGSLTQHPKTNMSSPLREIYHQIMDENSYLGRHPNPIEMRISNCIRI